MYALTFVLVRWSCCACGKTFRHYPKGVLPYKRYVFCVLLFLCGRYLRENRSSYRRVASTAGAQARLPLFHAGPVAEEGASERAKQREAVRVLSHVTLWRWITFLSQQVLRCAPQMEWLVVRTDRIDFTTYALPGWKYRSAERRLILEKAGRVWAALDSGGFSPELGTLASGP